MDAVANAFARVRERTAVVIDNVEQVAYVAGKVIGMWAMKNPLVRLVLTSRVALEVKAERKLEIAALRYQPRNDRAEPPEGIQLFRLRAEKHDASFRLDSDTIGQVQRICEAVEGLPLGIELATNMVGRQTLGEIERGLRERLDFLISGQRDTPRRHLTLGAAVDWSLDLLEPQSRSFMLQLSVAESPVDLAAIERIVEIPAPSTARQKLAGELLGAHLLVRTTRSDESLYRQRTEIRRRCSEHLRSGTDTERDASRRFQACFLERAEGAYKDRYADNCLLALDVLERDYDNFLFALQRGESDDPAGSAHAALALAWMCSLRRPGEPRHETLLRINDKLPPDELELASSMWTAISKAYLDLSELREERTLDEALRYARSAVSHAPALHDHVVIAEAHRQFVEVVSRKATANDTALLSEATNASNVAVDEFSAAREYAAAADARSREAFLPPISPEGAANAVAEAKKLLGSAKNPIVRFQILYAEVYANQLAQHPEQNRLLLRQLIRLADQTSSVRLRVRAYHANAVVQSELGNQPAAASALRSIETEYRTSGAKEAALATNLSDQAAVILRGERPGPEQLEEAIALLDKAVGLAGQSEVAAEIALPQSNRAWALLLRGRVSEAKQDSESACRYIDDLLTRDRQNAFIVLGIRAQILDKVGHAEEARQVAARALDVASMERFGPESANPQIRLHYGWLTQFVGVSSPPVSR